MTHTSLATIAWCLSVSVFCAGCAIDTSSSDPVDTKVENLSVETTRPLWTPGDTVKVCFALGSGITEDQFADSTLYPGATFDERLQSYYANAKELATLSLNETWATYANLDMIVAGNCPNPVPANWISVLFRPKGLPAGSRSVGAVGKGRRLSSTLDDDGFHFSNWDGRSDIQIFVGREAPLDPVDGYDNSRANAFRKTMIHEFGHSLGLPHEHNHPDETCGQPNDNARPIAPLTEYDPDSVMNYCKSDGRFLTALDQLGIEMLYPFAGTRDVECGEGCFKTTFRTLLVRLDGAAVDEWTARGALPPWWWDDGTIRFEWSQPYTGVFSNDEFARGSTLGPGTHSVAFSGRTLYTFVEIGGSGTVKVDTSLWTAIAETIL